MRAFQRYVAWHLHVRKSGWFSTFNGRESNWQFDYMVFFCHNLCFRCPNGSCKPILDIYVLISFQWYKKLFEPMCFDPCNCALKIQESIWDSNSHNGSSLGSVRVHSLTFFSTPKSSRCDFCSLLARNFASPCLGCKPKARVATIQGYINTMSCKCSLQYENLIASLIIKLIFFLNVGKECWVSVLSNWERKQTKMSWSYSHSRRYNKP